MAFDFDRLRAAQLTRYAYQYPLLAARLRGDNALYLFGTLGYEAVLRPDGSVWSHIDDDHPAQPPGWRPASEAERWEALAFGAREMPELAELLPPRPAGAQDCPACGGARLMHGRSGGADFEVCCPACGGLGWRLEAAT